MVKLKIGRKVFDIDKDDLILDNGACYQIVTKRVGFVFNESIPVMSKKMFNELRKCGLIFTSEGLRQAAEEKYNHSGLKYWKFDVVTMQKMGY